MWLNVGVTTQETPGEVACGQASALAAELVSAGVARDVAAGYFSPEGTRFVGGADDTFFDLASLTKPMTAVAFVAAGLPKDAPLAHFLPEVRGTPVADVTLELLFAHRAGMPAHISLFEPMLTGGRVDPAEALLVAARSREPLPAGGVYPSVYSDIGYVLAGAALARAMSARDAGEVIEELVATPLGFSRGLGTARRLRAVADFDARVAPTEVAAFRGGVVRGAVHDENAWALTSDGGSGHAGMFGTLAAVLAFARYTLALRDEAPWLFVPRPNGTHLAGFDGKSAEGSSAGRVLGPATYGHLGFTGTSFWVDPDARVGVSLLTNRVHPTRDNTKIREARPRAHDALARLAKSASARGNSSKPA